MRPTITYVRLDGSQFEGELFHPQMEHAAVVDPLDGRVKTFETVWYNGMSYRYPLKRVEMEQK